MVVIFSNRLGLGNFKKKIGKEDDNDRCRIFFLYDFIWFVVVIIMSLEFIFN